MEIGFLGQRFLKQNPKNPKNPISEKECGSKWAPQILKILKILFLRRNVPLGSPNPKNPKNPISEKECGSRWIVSLSTR